jgi:glucosamine 6-phosphate synthetase-like amidotransferase/phosphosugar isomerase protein
VRDHRVRGQPTLSEGAARRAQETRVPGYDSAEHVIYIPDIDPLLQVVLGIAAPRRFTHHIARARGLNVDRPRSLAKTVTVE